MDNRRNAALIAAAGLVVAVALFVILQSGGDDGEPATTQASTTQAQEPTGDGDADKPQEPKPEPQEPKLPQIEIKGGEPVGGAAELEFESGEEVRFEVTSDADDELHLHGYDLYFDLKAGKPAEISFDADLEGGYELESHTTGVLIANLSIVPG